MHEGIHASTTSAPGRYPCHRPDRMRSRPPVRRLYAPWSREKAPRDLKKGRHRVRAVWQVDVGPRIRRRSSCPRWSPRSARAVPREWAFPGSLVAGTLLALFGSGWGDPQSDARPDVYSVGAAGHRALMEFLSVCRSRASRPRAGRVRPRLGGTRAAGASQRPAAPHRARGLRRQGPLNSDHVPATRHPRVAGATAEGSMTTVRYGFHVERAAAGGPKRVVAGATPPRSPKACLALPVASHLRTRFKGCSTVADWS
jgi:hypothetical protein